ncbi:TPA: helix-turn-helix transcriptional regulator [Pseudomonas aeruginosa]|uniref:XRE family transcriptional regulator n=1 Tax=Pseudomonas aeruginosa TaxID=287 RepID=A0A367M833_PSEAI|nr:helix-turn-helix transcriptional regulator [Pseudomonas aeruginosa]AWR44218.1 XRE family transcriptional regulator [Pseudomonas aeruginosa]EIU6970670.1 helix-turn-helix transcriptional regulator [Pseudomonas aeruginosa]EIU6977416.1 helix-turn-helix transcriptional regulator [Pseudomonas aeruginosa]EIU7153069.1 helix-turn-helix transcriptional regulator [Pseudomonas aeruginosa]EKF7421582.1 helix-turn-helix transcriptional regulator [Pseudomonas aeruginosa]
MFPCQEKRGTFVPFFGERLRAERERLGFSQQEFADICGVTMRTQRNYEKGDRQPDASYLAALTQTGGDVLFVLTGQRQVGAAAWLIDVDRLARIVKMLEAFARDAGKRWPSTQLMAVAAEVYNALLDEPALDEPKVERILKLVVNR